MRAIQTITDDGRVICHIHGVQPNSILLTSNNQMQLSCIRCA